VSSTESTDGHPFTSSDAKRKDFVGYANRVVGTLADADSARAAIGALLKAGFARGDIDMLHGEEDLHRLDPTGVHHGFFAQFQRTIGRVFELEESKHLTHLLDDIRAGRFVIMVLAKRRGQRMLASDILHRHGAEFVGFYGRWAWEDLPASITTTPQEIPALFARAWNDRDPDAMAALFDEDAEFVNVSGLHLHDRDSIRKAHADGWQHSPTGTLASDDVKVKLLSPEIAIVHARLTRSGQAPPAPQTTIASFVVHRAGDRWLCAAAHTTDVVPHAQAKA
jgi:uncharacterized protein (TIGR02246 family)